MAATGPTRSAARTRQSLRHLSRALADASDHKLTEIVAMVDAMVQRGEADRLIVPLRARLALLRPARPLRFSRLLFLPLDPLIVAAPAWRPARHRLPRNAIMPLAEMVRRALGPEAEAIEACIVGCSTADRAVIAAIGPTLWPRAAAILNDTAWALAAEDHAPAHPLDPAIRATWVAAGLPAGTLAASAAASAAVLAEAAQIATLEADGLCGLPADPVTLQAMLHRAADQCVPAFAVPCRGLLVSLLLARLPNAAPLLSLIDRPSTNATPVPQSAAANQAIDEALEQLEEDEDALLGITEADLAATGPEAARLAALLDGLDTGMAAPARRHRIQAIRRRLDHSCRARFIEGLTQEILPRIAPAGEQGGSAWQALEADTRDLRRLESVGRRFGGGSAYDALLNEAAALAATSDTMPETLASRVRMVELLAGPEMAMAVMDATRRPAMTGLQV